MSFLEDTIPSLGVGDLPVGGVLNQLYLNFAATHLKIDEWISLTTNLPYLGLA